MSFIVNNVDHFTDSTGSSESYKYVPDTSSKPPQPDSRIECIFACISDPECEAFAFSNTTLWVYRYIPRHKALAVITMTTILVTCLKHIESKGNWPLFCRRCFQTHFLDDLITISLNCVPKRAIENTLALIEIMARRRTSDEPLSETMMA